MHRVIIPGSTSLSTTYIFFNEKLYIKFLWSNIFCITILRRISIWIFYTSFIRINCLWTLSKFSLHLNLETFSRFNSIRKLKLPRQSIQILTIFTSRKADCFHIRSCSSKLPSIVIHKSSRQSIYNSQPSITSSCHWNLNCKGRYFSSCQNSLINNFFYSKGSILKGISLSIVIYYNVIHKNLNKINPLIKIISLYLTC